MGRHWLESDPSVCTHPHLMAFSLWLWIHGSRTELTSHKAESFVIPSSAGFSGQGAPRDLCRKDMSHLTLLPLIPQMLPACPLTDSAWLWGEEITVPLQKPPIPSYPTAFQRKRYSIILQTEQQITSPFPCLFFFSFSVPVHKLLPIFLALDK